MSNLIKVLIVQFSYHHHLSNPILKYLNIPVELALSGLKPCYSVGVNDIHRPLLLSRVPRPQVVSVGCETSENHHQINLSASRLGFRMQLKYKI